MNAHKANLIHATILFLGSICLYYISTEKIALIPIVASVMLLTLNNGLQYKVLPQYKGAIVITILGLIGQYFIMMEKIGETDVISKRVIIAMIISAIFSIVFIAKEIISISKPNKIKTWVILLMSVIIGSCASQKNKETATSDGIISHTKLDTIVVPKVEIQETIDLPIDNGDYDVTYIMGKFDPAQRQDFVEIPQTYADRAGRFIRKDVFRSYKLMYDAALKEGVKFKIISATRNFENQKTIWENKWTGKTLLEGNINATTIKDPTERALRILKYSSMPGTSRHHWGTDIDLNSLENSYFDVGEGKKAYDWLCKNAFKYGFCQTYTAMGSDRNTGYQEERWHWTYMPVSIRLTEIAKHGLNDGMISGFLGSETAIEIEVVEKYILGISPKCLQMSEK